MPLLFVAVRYRLTELMADRAPFAFNFVAVILASVLAGWRAGLLALAIGQVATWYFILEPSWSLAIPDPERGWALFIATTSQALILLVVALYQREVDKGVAEQVRRLEFQEHARREIDHRISNNFQTVLSLIHLQAQRSPEGPVRTALQQMGERIKAIAAATEHLAGKSEDLTKICLRDYLCELCGHLERGLTREGIKVRCDVADLEIDADKASFLGIIVNELVTNALKHAFRGKGGGEICVECSLSAKGVELSVRDNGAGIADQSMRLNSGLGQALVKTFVNALGAEHELSTSTSGTVHRIVVPLPSEGI